jgi:hypothetical protein
MIGSTRWLFRARWQERMGQWIGNGIILLSNWATPSLDINRQN